jgi:pyruvate formate lyase activating enzyme
MCLVRFNKDGNLFVPSQYVSSLGFDPIEKKPFYHFLPGSKTLSYGMAGCNFKCRFCQNYGISQFCDDELGGVYIKNMSEEEILSLAKKNQVKTVVSTYNEPVISSEWNQSVFKLCKENGFKCAYVSNGHASREAIDYIHPYLDAINIDLKCFNERNYREVIGGSLQAVLDTITYLHKLKVHMEIVTLIIPGFNDSEREISDMAKFVFSLSCDIVWHLNAFHPDYKMNDLETTSLATLKHAKEIGRKHGLNHIYIGNVFGENSNVCCPICNDVLIKRDWKTCVNRNLKVESDRAFCKRCNARIPGVWS